MSLFSWKASTLGMILSFAVGSFASAQGTLRIGMTASDIPLTTGQTDQGGEGMRFMGYTVYDGLINWDLSSATKPSDLVPGLAESYGVDPADATKTRWIFKLREGVKFHDGSEFTADAVVWNLDKLLKNDSPQFDQRQSAQGRSRIPAVASLQGGRQVYARDHHQIAGRDAALPARLDHDVVAGAVGEARQELGRLRQDAVRHRPVEADAVRAARARRAGAQQGVLGQGARAQARQAGAAAAAGGQRPRRGAALRPGRLDRGAGAGCGRLAEVRRLPDRHQRLSAQLDLASVARAGFAVERHPRAQGRQPRDRPRGHEGTARRPDDPGRRLHAARPPVVRQVRRSR